MIILDHNIPLDQAKRLRRWRIRVRQIGFHVGRPEWQDSEELLRFLQSTKRGTLFTRDLGFFQRRFAHRNYCIVVLDVPVNDTATQIRWFLRSRHFQTQAQRAGCVIKISPHRVNWNRAGVLGRFSLDRS